MTDGTPRPRFYVPFLLGDALLLITAWGLFSQGNRPLQAYEMAAVGGCVALGAWLGVWPFLLAQRAAMRRMETTDLKAAVDRINQLDEVARRVDIATNKWQTAQDAADRTARAAREVAEAVETRQTAFQAFLQQANDAERQNLRLEVQKLQQTEGTWLQILVHLLDHTFALFTAAQRSGQQRVTDQIGRFQNACLDAVRRVGLTPLLVPPGVPYDPDTQDLADEAPSLPEGTVPNVSATLAPGYTYQGRLLRKPVVALATPGESLPEVAEGSPQPQPPVKPGNPAESPQTRQPKMRAPESGLIDPDTSEAPPSPS
ncbi:MAG: hypothetical protein H7A46_23805 [Verrucomicrobiales bacterium]|nr:hypothetical protein [Verrucomicrobiales bacterium]